MTDLCLLSRAQMRRIGRYFPRRMASSSERHRQASLRARLVLGINRNPLRGEARRSPTFRPARQDDASTVCLLERRSGVRQTSAGCAAAADDCLTRFSRPSRIGRDRRCTRACSPTHRAPQRLELEAARNRRRFNGLSDRLFSNRQRRGSNRQGRALSPCPPCEGPRSSPFRTPRDGLRRDPQTSCVGLIEAALPTQSFQQPTQFTDPL